MTEEQKILEILQEVKDPEIPVLSVVDMGIISGVKTSADATEIKMTPTFVGCPAMEAMKKRRLSQSPIRPHNKILHNASFFQLRNQKK